MINLNSTNTVLKKMKSMLKFVGNCSLALTCSFGFNLAYLDDAKAVEPLARSCFVNNRNQMIVYKNLTTQQTNEMNKTNFSSENARNRHILYTSMKNRFELCLDNSINLKGFAKKQIGNNTFQYTSQVSQFYLRSESRNLAIIYDRLIVRVSQGRFGREISITTVSKGPLVGTSN
ncbi:MAG: hypothetical protein ACRCXZ_00720 [Patescibacteria group bacterium]